MFAILSCALAQPPALPVAPPPREIPGVTPHAHRDGDKVIVSAVGRRRIHVLAEVQVKGPRFPSPALSDDCRYLAVPLELDILIYELPSATLVDTIPFPKPMPVFRGRDLTVVSLGAPAVLEVDRRLITLPPPGQKYVPYRPAPGLSKLLVLPGEGTVEVVDRFPGPGGVRRRVTVKTDVPGAADQVVQDGEGRYAAVRYKHKVAVVDLRGGRLVRTIHAFGVNAAWFAGRDLKLADGNLVGWTAWTAPAEPGPVDSLVPGR